MLTLRVFVQVMVKMFSWWSQARPYGKSRFKRFAGVAIPILSLSVAPAALALGSSSIEINGIGVQILSAGGSATLEAQLLGRFVLQIVVQPQDERDDLTLRVDLPVSGPQTWPAERVQVLNEKNLPLAVSRSGIQWHGLEFTVPPVQAFYSVRAQFPETTTKTVRLPRESDRIATDSTTGLSVKICRWFGGKRSALSLRFDDSDPTHLSIVVPVLDEYGFRGTFMINPGRSDFQSRKKEWEALAAAGRHEFANHTMHHRGATSDIELKREIGDASEYIWGLFPRRSRLVAMNIGGGTIITTVNPLQYFLDKYHVFPVWGSLGMDDVYGDRAAAFRRHLKSHVERGLWCRTHFHSIGAGLATSVEHFAEAMEVVNEFASEIWVAGLADAFKYQEEWKASRISLESPDLDEVMIRLTCLSDPELYDHPLSLEVVLPETWNSYDVSVSQALGLPVQFVNQPSERGGHVLRFDVAPVTGCYLVRRRSAP